MDRTISYTFRSLFMNAILIELRVFRAIGRAIWNFFAELICFILCIDIRDRRDDD
jgi:hypothetical protein